jgi:diketogulonate reductase-like aldo/keto reductase
VSNSYSPLGTNDFIKGKWNVSVFSDPTITKIAKSANISNAQVVLRWGLQKGERRRMRAKIFSFPVLHGLSKGANIV